MKFQLVSKNQLDEKCKHQKPPYLDLKIDETKRNGNKSQMKLAYKKKKDSVYMFTNGQYYVRMNRVSLAYVY